VAIRRCGEHRRSRAGQSSVRDPLNRPDPLHHVAEAAEHAPLALLSLLVGRTEDQVDAGDEAAVAGGAGGRQVVEGGGDGGKALAIDNPADTPQPSRRTVSGRTSAIRSKSLSTWTTPRP
jgi:hypothetical protein